MRTFSFFHKFYDLSFKETQKGYGYHQISLDDEEEDEKKNNKVKGHLSRFVCSQWSME